MMNNVRNIYTIIMLKIELGRGWADPIETHFPWSLYKCKRNRCKANCQDEISADDERIDGDFWV